MCIRSCLCWSDMKSPTIAVGTFALVTSLLQILVTVAEFIVYFNSNDSRFTNIETYPDKLPDVAKLYIALSAADFFVVLFSIILLVEVERSTGWRFCLVPWLLWIPLYILYESAINIYFFYETFSDSAFYFYKQQPEKIAFIIPLVYWPIKEIILFLGWLCVVSRMCVLDVVSHDYDSSGDPTLHLIPAPKTRVVQPTRVADDFYYSGASHVQVLNGGRPRPISHFDVARPVNNYQYGGFGGIGSGGGVYGGASRYIYAPN